jgi:hypothetical protein
VRGIRPPNTADLEDDNDTTEPTPLDLDGNPRFVDDPNTPDDGDADTTIVVNTRGGEDVRHPLKP